MDYDNSSPENEIESSDDTSKKVDLPGLKIHSVQYNFIMNFILTASNFIFPLITFPYVSRVLGSAGTGHVAFVSSYAAYFTLIAQLGIPTYGVRACARVRDDYKKLTQTVKEIFTISLIMSLIATAAYLISIFTVPSLAEDRTLFLITSITFILSALGVEWFFTAIEQYDYITIRSIIFKIVMIVLMFIFVHAPSDYIKYGAITMVAGCGSNILNTIRLHKYINLRAKVKLNLRRHIKPILILFTQSAVISIYTNLDILMLRFLGNYEQVGFYNAALKIQTILASFVNAFGNVLLPRMSYYVKHKMAAEFTSLMQKALKSIAFTAAPITFYMFIMAPACLALMSGDAYLPAAWSMRFLSVTVIFVGFTGITGIQVLTPLGKEKYVLYSVIAGACTDLVLNFFFIPMWGASGASLATLMCEIVVLIFQLYYTRDILKKISERFLIFRYFIFAAIASVPTYFVGLWDINVFLKIVITVFIFAGIYIGLLMLVKDSMLKETVGVIKNKIKKNK